MTELLAPAGNMEALRAAVSNGCDAVYLGLEKFGARAYSDNFTIDSLAEAIRYAHLRDVKIYVTMNTIVFEDEICDMRQQLDALNGIGVDGIIVQDLAVFDYVAANLLIWKFTVRRRWVWTTWKVRCCSKKWVLTVWCWHVR